MARNSTPAMAPAVTPGRAGRLYRLVSLTAEGPRTRKHLLGKLKLDVRAFYRDLEFLRGLGVDVVADGDKYHLASELDSALAKLPFPDPGLSFRDVLALSRGTGDAQKKLRRRIESYTGNGH